jgi:hypothetical protein
MQAAQLQAVGNDVWVAKPCVSAARSLSLFIRRLASPPATAPEVLGELGRRAQAAHARTPAAHNPGVQYRTVVVFALRPRTARESESERVREAAGGDARTAGELDLRAPAIWAG